MSRYYPRSYEDNKYHGLMNQGATCYLNSVLQVLFMTKDFREAVRSGNADGNHIDVQLASLFNHLKTETAQTVEVTKKLGIYRVWEQRDAAEHFEKILTLTSDEAAQIFQGMLSHKTRCSECDTETGEDAAFWDLPLALVKTSGKSYSVEDGIQEFFRESSFNGENQMYCDFCDAKCDATAKCEITHHPEVLMLLLKRFEFSYQQMAFVKNTCFVDVPSTLRIPENQMYELYAFVEHFGNLQSGHYTATIRDDGGRWYCFNDSSVTLLNNQPFQTQKTNRTRTAYLLFYRKKDTGIQDIEEPSNNRSLSFNTNMNVGQSPDVNRRDGGEDGVKSKGSYEKPSHARKRGHDEEEEEKGDMGQKAEANHKTEERKDQVTIPMKRKNKEHEENDPKIKHTEADTPTSRTDQQFDKQASFQRAKDERSISPQQDSPHKHEQQRDGKIVVHGDKERMTEVNTYPLRDGVHVKPNKPNKSLDDHREGCSSRDDPYVSQQKQNEGRKIGGDKEGMSGKAERKIGETSAEKKGEMKVKTDRDGSQTRQKEGGHGDTSIDPKAKTEAVRKARDDKRSEKLTEDEFESQKDITVYNPSKYQGHKEQDDHNRTPVEPSPKQAEPGKMGTQKQGVGSDAELGKSSEPKGKRFRKGNKTKTKNNGNDTKPKRGRFRKLKIFKSKKKSDKSKQDVEQRKGAAEVYFAQQVESEDEEMEKTTGCWSCAMKIKRNKKAKTQ